MNSFSEQGAEELINNKSIISEDDNLYHNNSLQDTDKKKPKNLFTRITEEERTKYQQLSETKKELIRDCSEVSINQVSCSDSCSVQVTNNEAITTEVNSNLDENKCEQENTRKRNCIPRYRNRHRRYSDSSNEAQNITQDTNQQNVSYQYNTSNACMLDDALFQNQTLNNSNIVPAVNKINTNVSLSETIDLNYEDSEQIFMSPINRCMFFRKSSSSEHGSNRNWRTSSKHSKKYKEVQVAYFYIQNIAKKIYDNSTFAVELECVLYDGNKVVIYINEREFENKKIKEAIENKINNASFTTNVASSKLNNLLYNYIKSYLREETATIYSNPGFYYENNTWKFYCDNFEYSNISYGESKLKKFTMDNNNYPDYKYIDEFRKFIDNESYENRNLIMLLTVLRISALLSTYYLNEKNLRFEKILSVLGAESKDSLNYLTAFLKIFNRNENNNNFISLNEKFDKIKNSIDICKDEFAFFTDDFSGTYNKNKNKENAVKLSNMFSRNLSDNCFEKCQCVIISDRLASELGSIAEESFLNIDFRNFSCNVDYKKIMEINYNIDKCVICNILSSNNIVWDKIPLDERMNELSYSQSVNAYKVLNLSVNVLADTLKEPFYEFLYNIDKEICSQIKDSETFNNEQQIIGNYFDIVKECILNDEFILFNKESDNYESEENKPVAYIDDDILLMNVNDFNTYISNKILWCIDDKSGVKLRKFLMENELIIVNINDRYMYKTTIDGKRKCFVAIEMNEFFDDIEHKLPIKKRSEWCADELNLDDETKRIYLGIDGNRNPVYWSVDKVQNKHMFVRGKTGSGKTYFLLNLAKELYSEGEEVLLIDSVQDIRSFDEFELEKALPKDFIQEHIKISDIWDETIFDNGKINIIQTTPKETQEIVADLLQYCQEHKTENKTIYLIIDEINQVNVNDNSQISRAIQLGRKVNLGVISATQKISGKGKTERRKTLLQSAVQITFKPDKDTAREVAKEIDEKKLYQIERVLKGLKKGEAIIYGEVENSIGEIEDDRLIKFRFEK